MNEVIKELSLADLQKRIQRIESIICLRLMSKDNAETITKLKELYEIGIVCDDVTKMYEFEDYVYSGDEDDAEEQTIFRKLEKKKPSNGIMQIADRQATE